MNLLELPILMSPGAHTQDREPGSRLLSVAGIGLATIGMLTSTGISPGVPAFLVGLEVSTGWSILGDLDFGHSEILLGTTISFGAETPARVSSMERSASTSVEMVQVLRKESGLTWDQLARLFGVSRRAVHLWASGGRMNAANQELLTTLLIAVRALAGSSPDERRAELLAPQPDGRSKFDELRSRHASGNADINRAAVSPEQALGVLGGTNA